MPSSALVVPAASLLAIALLLFAVLPAYALLLTCLTILRARWRSRSKRPIDGPDARRSSSPWEGVATSLYRGRVRHSRVRPTCHAFSYPLHFAVVDLDEAPGLFGTGDVRPPPESSRRADGGAGGDGRRGALWPLSTLMRLRDVDHLKNGEGLPPSQSDKDANGVSMNASMRERIANLMWERTRGKLDVRSESKPESAHRKILLVTHLMYYGYCFNPVSFFFVLKPVQSDADDATDASESEDEDGSEEDETDYDLEAIAVEVSNTPWEEMSIYVLHPHSVDVSEHSVHSSDDIDDDTKTYRYRWRKNFHVSPFMTMDHDYDWKFWVGKERLRVRMEMFKRDDGAEGEVGKGEEKGDGGGSGTLYFAAGFDIRRAVHPTWTYPLQLAWIIARYPVYCAVIQLWIHYEAVRLLIKGVQFIPHPEGSETGASRAIAAVVRPVFKAMDWWEGWRAEKAKRP
ncbi:hypothetical protein ACHAWF_014482 [Thalassiosira exigua]